MGMLLLPRFCGSTSVTRTLSRTNLTPSLPLPPKQLSLSHPFFRKAMSSEGVVSDAPAASPQAPERLERTPSNEHFVDVKVTDPQNHGEGWAKYTDYEIILKVSASCL